MFAGIGAGLAIAGGLKSLFGSNDAADAAADASNTASRISQAQWDYYLSNYQPLETNLIQQATQAGSPEEFARARGAANADVTGAFDAATKGTLNRMQSFGINPGSPAYQSAGASADLAKGSAMAGALTGADRNTRNLAYSKALDVVGLGRNIPAQSAASSANAANTATNASANLYRQGTGLINAAGYAMQQPTAASKWFGIGTQAPAPVQEGPTSQGYFNPLAGGTTGNYSNWGNDYGYADGGEVMNTLQRHGLHPMLARAQAAAAASRQAITPHMKYRQPGMTRLAQGGGVGTQGLPMPDMSNMGDGSVQGPGTETSDSVPAQIDGQQPAALSSGEFVMNAEVPRLTGDEILTAINEAGLRKRGLEPQASNDVSLNAGAQAYARGGRVMRYACGGLAGR